MAPTAKDLPSESALNGFLLWCENVCLERFISFSFEPAQMFDCSFQIVSLHQILIQPAQFWLWPRGHCAVLRGATVMFFPVLYGFLLRFTINLYLMSPIK